MLLRTLSALVGAAVLLAPARAGERERVAVVGYGTEAALASALQSHPAHVLRRLPELHAIELRTRDPEALRLLPGIAFVEPPAARAPSAEPALAGSTLTGGADEWQFAATHATGVPSAVRRAAAAITIAVVDTGADVTAPDLAAKSPATYSVVTGTADVTDLSGHGTFVAALAAGSPSNGEGISGFGGEARLLVVQTATSPDGFTDVDEAAAIVYAVDHGARIVNLSLTGSAPSTTELSAVRYAVDHGVLLVAAAGNDFARGDPVEYPAALLQPPRSNGRGGAGLSVGASDLGGGWTGFSNTGSWISLAAPGVNVFSALPARDDGSFHRARLRGSRAGHYGYGSGTSFAAPQVAGAAALVWAANPRLSAAEVAAILKATASGAGRWNPHVGFGVLDVAAAVKRALATR
jgi:subtilisin family serine protease